MFTYIKGNVVRKNFFHFINKEDIPQEWGKSLPIKGYFWNKNKCLFSPPPHSFEKVKKGNNSFNDQTRCKSSYDNKQACKVEKSPFKKQLHVQTFDEIC